MHAYTQKRISVIISTNSMMAHQKRQYLYEERLKYLRRYVFINL